VHEEQDADGGSPRVRAKPGLGVVPRACRPAEIIAPARVEREPGDGEIVGRISRRHIAEVDDPSEHAAARQQVARVEIAVEPHRRAAPRRRRDTPTPGELEARRRCGVEQPGPAQPVEPLPEHGVARDEGPAAHGVDGMVRGRRHVKRAQGRSEGLRPPRAVRTRDFQT
jgi:hypothetical protein